MNYIGVLTVSSSSSRNMLKTILAELLHEKYHKPDGGGEVVDFKVQHINRKLTATIISLQSCDHSWRIGVFSGSAAGKVNRKGDYV